MGLLFCSLVIVSGDLNKSHNDLLLEGGGGVGTVFITGGSGGSGGAGMVLMTGGSGAGTVLFIGGGGGGGVGTVLITKCFGMFVLVGVPAALSESKRVEISNSLSSSCF